MYNKLYPFEKVYVRTLYPIEKVDAIRLYPVEKVYVRTLYPIEKEDAIKLYPVEKVYAKISFFSRLLWNFYPIEKISTEQFI